MAFFILPFSVAESATGAWVSKQNPNKNRGVVGMPSPVRDTNPRKFQFSRGGGGICDNDLPRKPPER